MEAGRLEPASGWLRLGLNEDDGVKVGVLAGVAEMTVGSAGNGTALSMTSAAWATASVMAGVIGA